MARRRFRPLAIRLLIAFLLPTLTLFAIFGLLVLRLTERSLEDSLGRRLTGIAQTTATQVRAEALNFLGPGDDESRTAKRIRRRLSAIVDRTGAARVSIIDRRLKSLCDTDRRLRIGDRYYNAEADRAELARVFSGAEASSVLFRGTDGRHYKTGYAPIFDGKQVIAAVGVAGSAEFLDAVDRLRSYLLLSGTGVFALVSLLSFFVARRITRPLRALATEAARIGAGELERPISVSSNDEAGLLAQTMNQMRQDLFLRDQQLQMMLSGIAHEVRNPLGGIALFAGLLREELEDDQERLELVQRIERELEYLKNVVGEFLDYARRSPLDLAPLDLRSLIADVQEMLQADAEAAEIALLSEAQPALASADVEHLRRVLLNLGRNALQATSAGGKIWLRCGFDDEAQPFFEVEDTGCGIDQETLARIFEPFYTTREKGTGLGLALSKKIVDDHQGRIEVSSSPAGTRFRVTLVAANEKEPEPESIG